MTSNRTRKGYKNIYLCHACGHGFVSIDTDDGVTPFTTGCRRSGCTSVAMSLFYRCPQEMLANITPAIDWYRPAAAEVAMLSPATREHVDKGGLLLRPHLPPPAFGRPRP